MSYGMAVPSMAVSLISLASGAALGIFYFGGLWLTVRRLPSSQQPALLTLGSFLARSFACLLGFYLIAGLGLEGLVIGLVGFTLTKVALVRRLGYKSLGKGS